MSSNKRTALTLVFMVACSAACAQTAARTTQSAADKAVPTQPLKGQAAKDLLLAIQTQAYEKNPRAKELLRAGRDLGWSNALKMPLESQFGPAFARDRSAILADGPAFEELIQARLSRTAPTALQEPLSYAILCDAWDDVLVVAHSNNWKLAQAPPLFGTAPGQGLAVKEIAIDGDHLVLFDIGTFVFCENLFVRACNTVEFSWNSRGVLQVDHSTNAFLRRLNLRPRMIHDFGQTVSEFAQASRFSIPPAEANYVIAPLTLRLGTTLFIVGHEFKHAASDDWPPQVISLGTSNGLSKSNLDNLVKSWRHEILADGVGFQLMKGALAIKLHRNGALDWLTDSPEFGSLGILIYFQLSDYVDEVRFMFTNKLLPPETTVKVREEAIQLLRGALRAQPASNVTFQITHPFTDHPPYWLRREILLQTQIDQGAGKPSNQKNVLELILAIQRNLEVMWKVARPQIYELAKKS
jgi:hypothetical protein